MRILIVGLGSIAKKHIAALRQIEPAVEIYAIRNVVGSAEIEGVKNIYQFEDIDKLNPDFCIISNPTSQHKTAIEKLIPLGIPLFIEKPLFDSINGKDVIDQINNKQLITYVACNLRFLSCLAFAKQFIEDKRINEVNIYCGSNLPDWRPSQDFRKTYSANKEMGGGVHIDLIHELDYAIWLFDMPVEVFRFTNNSSSLQISAVDYANFLLKYDTFCVNVVLNYYRKDPKRTLEVVCEEGTLLVDIIENKVCWKDEIIFQSGETIIDTYLKQMSFFINNIITKKTLFNDVNEAYKILKLCIQED